MWRIFPMTRLLPALAILAVGATADAAAQTIGIQEGIPIPAALSQAPWAPLGNRGGS